jgi:hypothetical protein
MILFVKLFCKKILKYVTMYHNFKQIKKLYDHKQTN